MSQRLVNKMLTGGFRRKAQRALPRFSRREMNRRKKRRWNSAADGGAGRGPRGEVWGEGKTGPDRRMAREGGKLTVICNALNGEGEGPGACYCLIFRSRAAEPGGQYTLTLPWASSGWRIFNRGTPTP